MEAAETSISLQKTKTCVLIPTYNNEKTLSGVIEGVLEFTSDVIVVNDGSTDGTTAILDRFKDRITVVSYHRNRGKGYALRKGFRKAIALGFQHVITIDSDGQHFPEDLKVMADAIEDNPDSLIMGARNMQQEGVPQKSSFGNRFSNFWYWINTGYKLPDTQTGYRVYPLRKIRKMRFFTRKFEFEIEVIVRLAWRGVKVLSVPVQVAYEEDRVSHFRPAKDFFRISVLNTVLVLLTLLVFFHIRMIRKVFSKSFYEKVKNEVLAKNDSKFKKSASIGYGLMVGVLPIWGFQIAFGLGSAWLLRLNKFLVITFAHISIPPAIPFILFASFQFGKLFVSNPVDMRWEELTLEYAYQNITQYVIGAIMLGIALLIVGFITMMGYFYLKDRILKPKTNDQ